jgi:murein DD-endopeptidase MepM/ murein hydrolase activator NlpD
MIKPVLKDRGRYRRYGYQLGNKYHNGHDFDCDYDDDVYSIARGEVIYISNEVAGFGGTSPDQPGGVVIVEHINNQGHKFVALYGHVESDLMHGEKLARGQLIGKVQNYYLSGLRLPHLHFAINIKEGIPKGKWGYVTDLKKYGWVNPIEYMKDHC